jgi:hypothetical protein
MGGFTALAKHTFEATLFRMFFFIHNGHRSIHRYSVFAFSELRDGYIHVMSDERTGLVSCCKTLILMNWIVSLLL